MSERKRELKECREQERKINGQREDGEKYMQQCCDVKEDGIQHIICASERREITCMSSRSLH